METTLLVSHNDITAEKVDIIVNAANRTLLGGGGVDGAIHRVGGPDILAACKVIRQERGDLPTGQAVATTAGKLQAKYVIHTVGPIWTGKDIPAMKGLLADCYRNSLSLADNLRVESIAFPNISTGVYRFPKELAAEVAIRAIKRYLNQFSSQIKEVRFVCFDAENHEIYQKLFSQG
ncbi:MAG: O-acetyl-ADP-ribose deacetylase [Bacteroidia bacterium]|nr:O-acetyl-ADP-ribose deacetylase [Bacteroidia bacterium]